MTLTSTPPAASPVRAPRANLIFTGYDGAHWSPLTWVRHARRTRRIAFTAILAGLISITTETATVVTAGAW